MVSACSGDLGRADSTPAVGPTSTATSSLPASDDPVSIDGTWELVSLVVEGEQFDSDDWPGSSVPWIRFEPSLLGWTGCNSFYTYGQPEYRVAGGVLTLGDIVIENAGCEDRRADVEAGISRFLWGDHGVTVGFDGDRMTWTLPGEDIEAVLAATG